MTAPTSWDQAADVPDTWFVVIPHEGAPMRPHFWLSWNAQAGSVGWMHVDHDDLDPPAAALEFETLAEAIDNTPPVNGPPAEVVSRRGWAAASRQRVH